jgi:uncharacterized protein YkwD
MKKLILILLLIQSQIVVSQATTVSQDSVNIYFQNIVNQYRINNNRNGLSIDTTLSPFTKSWSEYTLERNYCGHGDGDESFENRAIRFEPTRLLYCTENVVGPWDFNKDLPYDIEDPNYSYYTKIGLDGTDYQYKLSDVEISTLVESEHEITKGVDVNKNMAIFIFYSWKNSPSHNDALLDSNTTKFYVSITMVGYRMTASYLATSSPKPIVKKKHGWLSSILHRILNR